METTIPAAAHDVQWRHLDAHLWTARRDGAPIGLVERGSGFTAIDAGDRVLGRFRTLAQAKAAVASGETRVARGPHVPAPWIVTGVSLVVVGVGGALLLFGG